MAKAKQDRLIGTYRLGDEWVKLYLRSGTGGDFSLSFLHDLPMGSVPVLRIGADNDDHHILAALIHEAQEFALARMCLRFTPDDEWGRDSASRVFMMRHEQFSDMCARCGMFLDDALSDIKKAVRRWRKEG